MMPIPFTRAAKERKQRKALLSAARVFVLSHEDLESFIGNADFVALHARWAARDAEGCGELLAKLDPPRRFAVAREWLDVLVVSISVAMCFRAYFYEPFNIPTGSMQPTLYGNHSEACEPLRATWWDRGPQKWLKWAITGATYACHVAPFAGHAVLHHTNAGRFDMRVYAENGAVSKAMMVPTDALPGLSGDAPDGAHALTFPGGLKFHPDILGGKQVFVSDSPVRAGQTLWSGYDVTGDFLFVNRWIWNFRHPRRGDVMVFSTTGINGLQQGTHYIKRMTGLPGETVEIRDSRVLIDGVPVPALKPSAGARGERMPPPNPARMTGAVRLGADEFFACGDNSDSSYDSRYWGAVPAKNLCGRAGGVFWPLANARWGSVR